MPNEEEKELIFKVHISKIRPKSWEKYDIKLLSQMAKKFSGAEVEESIIEAMHIAFSENREFLTEDILKVIDQSVPLAYINKEKIDELQEWASSGQIRLAS